MILSCVRNAFGIILTTAVVIVTQQTAAAQPCPNPPPVVINSSKPPTDVCLPPNVPGVPFQFFDDFSWRSFVALVWPALNGQRGTPDPNKTVGGTGPRVFETYKGLYEVFHNDGSAPAAWNNFDPPAQNPCNVQMGFGDLTLGSFSKFSNLGQAGFGSLVGPLVAQNQTYVRYLAAFDQTEFTAIANGKWYLRTSIPTTGVTFPNGAIDIKSAWIDMTNKNPARFYTRTAWLLDPATGLCSQKLVGLVGLHIVQKTPTRPQWIWSSFEQVDNVQEAGAQSPFNFNNGKGTVMPSSNPYKIDPLPLPTPAPFNVTRITPISTSTQATNAAYQKALAGTPWQFYKLVMTQWPICNTPPCSPTQRGTPGFTFPGTGATTAFANTTLETFDQASIGTGCMACHNMVQTVAGVKQGTDFLFSLRDHAFPANVPNLLLSEEFRQLQTLIRGAAIPAATARDAGLRNQREATKQLKNKGN
jgi:hypothetical protein